jgi:hypothetical protein
MYLKVGDTPEKSGSIPDVVERSKVYRLESRESPIR